MTRAELERRPLLVLCLCLILGLTLPRHPLHLLLLVPAPWLITISVARWFAAVGVLLGAIFGPGQPPLLLTEQTFVSDAFRVASLPKITPFGQRCEIENGASRLSLGYSGPATLCPGQLIRVVGLAKPPSEGMDEYFHSRGMSGKITVSDVAIVEDGPWLERLGVQWRARFLELANAALPKEAASATASLAFNADGMLDDDTREELRQTGTTHIIAASGLQVLIVAQSAFLLLALLPIPRVLQLGVVAALLLLYAIATGMHPPVVRAGLMFIFANGAYLVQREPDWPSALAASSILILVWQPLSVYDMGFQFSVLAVLFLSLFGGYVPYKRGAAEWWFRWLRRSVRTAVVASVVMAPLIAYHFGYVSLLSIPANLLLVVAVTPVVLLAMAAVPIASLSPAAGALSLKATQPFTGYIVSVLHSMSGEYGVLDVPDFSPYWLVLFYGLLLMLARPYVRRP